MAKTGNLVLDSKVTADEKFRSSLDLFYEIGREIAAALDLRAVLHRLLFLSMENVGAISGSIIVLDEERQPVESAFLILGQTHDQTALQLKVTYDRGMAGWVARNEQAVLVQDTRKDERWLRRPDDDEMRTGSKSAVSAPILAQDKLVGVITLVHPSPGFFNLEHLELVKAIADQAGTAIRHAQLFEGLQAAHRQYQELFEDSIDPILISDWQGNIVEANRRAVSVMGLSRDEIVLTDISTMQLIDWGEVGTDYCNLESGKTVSYETVLRSYDEREIPVKIYVRDIHYEGESHLQWIIRDISERKALDNFREDLIAMVYHDLRSPLANVVSSLEVLSSILDGQDATIDSLLNIALRSTDRIHRLTNSLLDINRLEAGQEIGDLQPVSPIKLVEDAIDAVQPALQGRKLEIDIDMPSNLPNVLADADMMRRVLINLFENAIRFSPSKGIISIGAKHQNGDVLVWVDDDGPGISNENQEKIFEKFARVSESTGSRGLGLGLAYCRLAVGRHGGRIWVESEPSKGSSFRFTIPVAN